MMWRTWYDVADCLCTHACRRTPLDHSPSVKRAEKASTAQLY